LDRNEQVTTGCGQLTCQQISQNSVERLDYSYRAYENVRAVGAHPWVTGWDRPHVFMVLDFFWCQTLWLYVPRFSKTVFWGGPAPCVGQDNTKILCLFTIYHPVKFSRFS